ncbi:uncharacterized protein [Watersipora subatra]|uniref:uncharacterized protein n=1 Tax=Watersipora subatra TaxID=2589382 RepID=UPI00355B8D88
MDFLRLALVACLATACYGSTAGTRFHLVFMENVVEAPLDGPLEVHVSNTGSLSATVTVSSPMTTCASQTLTVPANSNVMFEVCWFMRLVATDYWPSYKTVLVESNRDVMVYAYNKERFSADGYYAIPVSELAYSYYVAAYDEANIATQFAISATRDTSVQIVLPSLDQLPVQINYKGLIYRNGDTFTISLTEYETFLGQSRGDITGAKIIADYPIAVFSGNIRNKDNSGSRDHLAAQLQATGDWGTQYVMAPVPRSENFGDVVRVVARRQNTPITLRFPDGTTISQTIAAPGDTYQFDLNSAVTLTATNSNKPVQVIQMVRSQAAPKISDVADPSMFLLVTRSQWLNEYISPSLFYSGGGSYDKNMAFLAIQDGQEAGLRINGFSVNSQWTRNNGIASAWVDVNAGSNRFTHSNNQDFNVMVYGASDRESYGFALGADLSNSQCQESFMIRGDGLDNDCDNSIDEESCNGVDDDNDGEIDEDCETGSQEAFGNEYVIMFMENNVDDNPNAQSFLEIYMSGVDSLVDVSYSITTETGMINQTIGAGQVEIVDALDPSLRQEGSGIDTKAIRIQASSDIVVYGINKQTWSTDGFLAFPVDVVGTEYYSAHYYPGTDLNEFAFTPVFRDGGVTTVTVTMPTNVDDAGAVNSQGRFGNQVINPGDSIIVTLSYGETAQFQGASNTMNLNGAHIVSDKPISMFSGNVRARVDPVNLSSRDHLVHQLAPVSTWGLQFVTAPIPRERDRGDVFFITASAPNTGVEITITTASGLSRTSTENLANAGDYVRVDIGSNEYGFFDGSRPIQVFQYVKTTNERDIDVADPAMMLIPPVEQWSRNYQFITPRTGQADGVNGGFLPFDTFVMIAIEQSQISGLRLDGGSLPSPTWVTLPSQNGVVYAVTSVQIANPGRHSLSHVSADVYFQALMYGRANRESFALPLGMRLVRQGCTPTTMGEGDNIDNDCDGTIDEEICNGIDDDVDGAIDEDCGDGLSSGTNFYLAYMENTVEYPQDLDLELYVAVVGNQAATVSVRTPLFPFPDYNIMTEIQPGEVQAYGLATRLKGKGQNTTGNGIYVRANADVVVYGVNKEKFSNDAFLVYPENTLGTDYYTCHWSPSTLPTEFAVVATSDNTVVTITLPSNRNDIAVLANGRTYNSGDRFDITLQRFQVYQGQSDGDLTGTRIQSSIRVAVFAGNVRTKIELSGSRDHLVQQMLPTVSYGSTFYVVPFPFRTVGDVLRIVARNSNTQIRVNGNLIGTIPNAGDFWQYQLASTSRITLTSSSPVMVIQFVKSQDGKDNPEEADPAMFVVPSSSNFIRSATFITPVYSGGRVENADYINYATIVIANGQQGNVRLNGQALSGAVWDNIPSSSFVTTTVLIESGRSHTITTTSNAEFYGRLYGRADRESYAFPIGFQL